MTDSTGLLSDAVSSEATETQLAQAGDSIVVTRPEIGTTIQIAAPGDHVQLNFDPDTVAKAEIKDGNLEITFDNGSMAVIQGYEAWAAAGGQPTGPQGGAVDIAQLGQASAVADQAAADSPAVCEMPNASIVDVPVPAAGERIALAVQPGDVIRLACSFRDVAATEAGDSLEMTFPGGGMVVVENFSAWVAAQGATVTDCVCGGLNLAEFIVAIGLNPEDVLPAAGGAPSGPQGNDLTGSGFTPDPGPQILTGLPYPHILLPTALGYGVPGPDRGIFPDDEEQGDRDLGGPLASAPDPLVVSESTQPLQVQVQALSFQLAGFDALADADGEGCAPPTGPVQFVQDEDSGQIFVNDDFGPDGQGEPPLVSFEYTGTTAVDDVNGILQPDGVTLRITSTDPTRPWYIDVDINTGLATVHLTGTYDHTGPNSDGNIALETFNYTIQDIDGDTSSTQVTVQIVDSVPVAYDDCEVCIVEPGNGTDVIEPVGGNVMANDDLGADQFLPEGTDLISFSYDNGTQVALVPEGGSTTVTTAIGGELTVHSNGDWSYTPPASVDNSECDVHDDFTYTIRDGDGDTSPAVQPICIRDGAEPVAYDNKQCVNEGATQNVMIVADVSGSMGDKDIDPNTDGKQTRIELEKESLTALVDKYAALDGTVTITLIAFASGEDPDQPGGSDTDGARNLGTFTFSGTTDQGYLDAIAAIDSLAIGMDGLQINTEYDDALLLAEDVLAGQLLTQAEGTTNTVYFLSDGNPDPDSNNAGTTDWQDFVNSKNIEVVALGIGKGVSTTELDAVEDGGDKSVIVDDQGDLAGLLTNIARNASVSGNVLIDPTEEPNISPANDPVGSADGFGSDGAGAPKIISLQHDGHTYDPTDVVGGEGGTVLNVDGSEITVLTELGGTLTFDFETGHYTYTSPDKVDHGKDAEVDERFTYTIQDSDGDTDPADLVICIKGRDDVPNANADTNAAQAQTINLVIIFDRSGSMDEDPNVPGFTTRIDLARAAVASMLAAYESVANVNVLVVDFSSSANSSGWLSSGEDANFYLAGLEADGDTDYTDAVITAMSSYNNGTPQADQTLVYFLSDGKPDPANRSLQATGTTSEWGQFLTNEGIEQSVAVGIGPDVDDSDGDLSDVAFANNPIIVDQADVFDALVATVNAEASGNVLTDGPDDQFGADGPGSPQIVSIVLDDQLGSDVLYEFDGAQITRNGVLSSLGSTLVVVTALGGTLTFNFSNGDYTYEAPSTGGQEQFTYTIADNDGDTSSATLTIDLDDLQVEQPAGLFGTNGSDGVLNGGSGIDIIGGGDGNDIINGNGGNDHITGGAGTDSIIGGLGNDVIIGGSTSENDNNSNVIRAADGNDTIDGGEGDDFINGGDGADLIHGGAGNDVIIGGVEDQDDGSANALDGGDIIFGDAGNDTIIGGHGSDTITGGQGDDVIDLADAESDNNVDTVFFTTRLDGHDVISTFDNDGANHDVVNLDGLLDDLVIAGPSRDARVEFFDVGADVELRVDTDNNAANGFEMTVVTFKGISSVAAISDGNAASDDVILGS